MSATAPSPVYHRSRLNLAVLLTSVALANVAYTVLIPFVPVMSQAFGMSTLAIGVAFGGFAGAKALAQPVGGWCADHVGARATAAAGLTLAAAATAVLALASSGSQIIGLRLLWGIGEGFALPALFQLTSSLSRIANVGEARAMGWFGAAAVAGMTAGPGLVILLSGHLDFRGVFLLGAALTFLSAVSVAALRIPHPGRPAAAASPPSPGTGHSRRLPHRPPKALLIVAALGLADLVNNFIYAALEPVVPLYADERLGASQGTISAIFFIGLALFAVVSAAAGGTIAKVGYARATAAAFVLQTAGLTVSAFTTSLTVFAIAFFFVMTVQPVVYVALRASVAEVGRNQPGMAFGWFGFVSDIGWIAGPIAASVILAQSGAHVFTGMAVLAGVAAIGTAAWGSRSNATIETTDSKQSQPLH